MHAFGRNGRKLTRGDILCKGGVKFVAFQEVTQTGQIRVFYPHPYYPGNYLTEVVSPERVRVTIK